MKLERELIGVIILVLFLVLNNYNSMENIYMESSVFDLLQGDTENQYFIDGPIISTFNNGFIVLNDKNGDSYLIKTRYKVYFEDHAYILGNVNSHNLIIPKKIIITQEHGIINVILRSLLGLMIFLFIFHRYWEFNLKKVLFIRRK